MGKVSAILLFTALNIIISIVSVKETILIIEPQLQRIGLISQLKLNHYLITTLPILIVLCITMSLLTVMISIIAPTIRSSQVFSGIITTAPMFIAILYVTSFNEGNNIIIKYIPFISAISCVIDISQENINISYCVISISYLLLMCCVIVYISIKYLSSERLITR